MLLPAVGIGEGDGTGGSHEAARGRAGAALTRRDGAAVFVVLGLAGSIVMVLGGALAGASGPVKGTGRVWSVPGIPVAPGRLLVPAVALFFAGLIILTRSWLGLRHRLRARENTSPRLVLAVFALWALPVLAGPPLGSRDVYSYAAAGQVMTAGLDPYDVGPNALGDDVAVAAVDPTWRDQPSPYGPLFLALTRAVQVVSDGRLVPTILLYRLLALGGLGLMAVGLTSLARSLGRDPADALVLALCNPLTLLHLVSGAHNDALMVGLLVVALAAGHARRPYLGAAVCGLAAAVKAPAVLGVAYLGWTAVRPGASARQRAVGLAGAAGAAFLSMGLTTMVSGAGWGWVRTFSGGLAVDGYLSPVGLLSILGRQLGFLAGPGRDLVSAVGMLRLTGLAMAGITAVALLRRSDELGLWAPSAGLLGIALLIPSTQAWYLLWGLMIMAAQVAGTPARPFVVITAVTSFLVLPGGPKLGSQILAANQPLLILLLLVSLLAITACWPQWDRHPSPA